MKKNTMPVNQRPTIEVIGMTLPIIADLGDGWFLVAHPNGAAIATAHSLSALWTEATETNLRAEGPVDEPDGSRSGIPETIRSKAVEAFEKFAWPFVRGQFHPCQT